MIFERSLAWLKW